MLEIVKWRFPPGLHHDVKGGGRKDTLCHHTVTQASCQHGLALGPFNGTTSLAYMTPRNHGEE